MVEDALAEFRPGGRERDASGGSGETPHSALASGLIGFRVLGFQGSGFGFTGSTVHDDGGFAT